MSTMTAPTVDTRIPSGDGRVHHHSVAMSADEFLRRADNGLPIKALCGYEGRSTGNPLRLPCCPECFALLREPCPRGRS